MAGRGRTRGRGQNNTRNRTQAPGGRRRNRNGQSQVGQDIYHFRKWINLSSTATNPRVPANQTRHGTNFRIHSDNFPDLTTLFDRYQTVVVNSIGARMVSGVSSMDGNHAVVVAVPAIRSATTVPNPITLNWARSNGCAVGKVTNTVSANPSSDAQKSVIACSNTAGSLTVVGDVWWVFEGPSSGMDRNILGDIEAYVDLTFRGLKA